MDRSGLIEVMWATPRDPSSLDPLLDQADRAHLAWLRTDRARSESATARALLRGALTSRPGPCVEVERECPHCGRPHGRPRVAGLHVSASHTDGRVAVAITTIAPVGIDIELDRADRFKGVAITPAEWTRREAVFKSRALTAAFDPEHVDGRDAVDIDLGRGYVGAISVQGVRLPEVVVIAADDLLTAWAVSAVSPRTARA